MNFLFWLFWIVDLLLVGLLVAGSSLRLSFGASTDLNSWLTILTILVVLANVILRFTVKQKHISLLVAALPVIVLFLMYIFEKKTKYE